VPKLQRAQGLPAFWNRTKQRAARITQRRASQMERLGLAGLAQAQLNGVPAHKYNSKKHIHLQPDKY